MLEFLVGAFFEFLLPVLVEVLLSFAITALTEPFRKMPLSWFAGMGAVVLGAAFGGFSLVIFPTYLITRPALRLVNLAITPVLAGGLAAAFGNLLASRGRALPRLDRFVYGYLFAMAFGVSRFLLAAN